MPIPELITKRLRLRSFRLQDAQVVQRLVGEKAIAANTQNIPHPYPEGAAEQWIGAHAPKFERGEAAIFAITLKAGGRIIGAIGLQIDPDHQRGEMGYWIATDLWNQGYATEAGEAVVGFAFRELELNRVFASHFDRNPASGRVMQKLGMKHEGRLRDHILKWGEYVDLEMYGILRQEFQSRSK